MDRKETKSEIISVSLPKQLAQAVQQATDQSGKSRSHLVQQALEQYLWLTEWQDVQAYGVERSTDLALRPSDVTRLIKEYRREKKQASRRR